MIASLANVVRSLNHHGVRYIIVGSWAAMMHGAPRAPKDLDMVYARDHDNMRRLREALLPWHPDERGVPKGMPPNFALATDWGVLDFMVAVDGGGPYEQLLPYTVEV